MDIQLINNNLLSVLHWKAKESERQRQNFDLRTSPDDGSQRMLNVLEPGTHVPIHRHLKTSETVVCLEGCFDEIFYEELPHGGLRRTHTRRGARARRASVRRGGPLPHLPPRRQIRHPDSPVGMAHHRSARAQHHLRG